MKFLIQVRKSNTNIPKQYEFFLPWQLLIGLDAMDNAASKSCLGVLWEFLHGCYFPTFRIFCFQIEDADLRLIR